MDAASASDMVERAADVDVGLDTPEDTSVEPPPWPEPPEIVVAPPAPALADCAPLFVNTDGVCEPHAAFCGEFEIAVPTLGCVDLEAGLADAVIPADAIAVVSEQARARESGPSFREAVATAPAGATLVLGPGDHIGGVTIDRPIRVVGAGVRSTTIVSDDASGSDGTFVVEDGGHLILSDLSFDTSGSNVSARGGTTEIERVVFQSSEWWGIGLAGTASVAVRRAGNRGQSVFNASAGGAPALVVEESSFTIEASNSVTINALGTTTFRNVSFERVGSLPNQGPVLNFVIAPIELDRVTVFGLGESIHSHSGVSLQTSDVVLIGPGLILGAVFLTRTHIDFHAANGMELGGAIHIGHSDLSDVTLLGAAGDQLFGFGLRVSGDTTARRIRIEGTEDAGLLMDGYVSFDGQDVDISGVEPRVPGIIPVGASVGLGGRLTLTRARIVALGYGVRAVSDCVVDLNHVSISGGVSLSGAASVRGAGILANAGASVRLRDVVISGTRATGISTYLGHIDADRVWIRDVYEGTVVDVKQGPISGIADGILAIKPTSLRLDHVYVNDCERGGVVVLEPLGNLEFSRVVGARYGVATIGDATGFIGEGNRFDCEVPIWSDATLAVPNYPVF